MSWKTLRLGEIAAEDRQIVMPDSAEAAVRPYLGLEEIESGTGRILSCSGGSAEGKSTTFAFDSSHVLYGKLRPYLNKVAVPEHKGRCSTEIIPLLPQGVDREFLAFLLRIDAVVNAAMSEKTGSRMPRADMNVLFDLEVAIPETLSQQRQIAARLKAQLAEVDTARQAVRAQLREADLLRRSVLQAAFNDLSDVPVKPLGQSVVSYRNGFGKRPGAGETGPIVLRIADVSSGKINLSTPRRGIVSAKEAETYRLRVNDLLFIRVNGAREIVGRCCVVGPEAPADTIFNDHLIRVCLKPGIDPEFVRYCSSTLSARAIIEKAASTSAGQLTINQQVIEAIAIPELSLKEQHHFVHRLKSQLAEVDTLYAALISQQRELDALPQRLLAQAFTTQGENLS